MEDLPSTSLLVAAALAAVYVFFLTRDYYKHKMNEALLALQAEINATQALVSGDLQKNANAAIAVINTPDPNADQVVALTGQVSSLKTSIKSVSDQLASAVSAPPVEPTF